MISISRYTSADAQEWDAFVRESRNGTFLFLRPYMDYHSDRFKDHSLLFRNEKGKLIAVLPANEHDGKLYSHQGITYGGFVLAPKAHMEEVGEMFDATLSYLHEQSFTEWHYKQIPSVYHKIPSEEDAYWLWRHNAKTEACNMMTAVPLNSDINITSSRKHTYCNKLQRQGYTLEMDADISLFWQILEANLMERFGSKPVHSLAEMQLLKGRFPENIICCVIRTPNNAVVAGTLLYVSDQVVRTQYISASHEGKTMHALDYLMLALIEHFSKYSQYKYFEFGTSMAEDAVHLNDSLLSQKEEFGGRAIVSKVYSLKV